MTFAGRYGPWALVTGAARGLGAGFARQLAARGLRVILVDVDQTGLDATAGAIRAQYGVECRTVVADLTAGDFLPRLLQATDGLEIGLLVNNAGIGPIGAFLDSDPEGQDKVTDLNIRAPMRLTRALAPAMRARARGGLIFVSSLSGLQGTALVAHYAATKAWNQIFAEGLWAELRGTGVDVLAVLVGATRTPAFVASTPDLARAGLVPVMEVEDVVREALDALGNAPSTPVGRLNRVFAALMRRLLPRRTAIRLGSDTMYRLYGP